MQKKYLYKYVKPTTLKAILEHPDYPKIRFSCPETFNDPFDCGGEDTSLHDGEFSLKKDSAILCLSEKLDLLPMWAYYADDHRGAVIEFDLDASRKKNAFLAAANPVIYSDNVPTKVKDKIYYKGVHWKHEYEWRVPIVPFADDDPRKKYFHPNPIENDQAYSDEKFYPEEINSIIFGLRASKENIENIKQLLKQDRYKHIKLFQMHKIPNQYKIEKKKCDSKLHCIWRKEKSD